MITNTVSKVTYTGNGTTKQFQVTFPFIATTDLQLFLRTVATGEYEEIDSNWSYDEGYVTYPVTGSAITDTKQIVIQRNTPLTQEKDHNVRLFTSEDVEGMADKLTQITQELKRDIEEVSSPESIDIDIASAIGRHDVHPQAHYDLFANKVAKTGDTMTGDLTLSNRSFVIFKDGDGDGYGIRSVEYNGQTQLRIYKYSGTGSGSGMYLDSSSGNKPFYYDGQGHAARLLNTDDKAVANGVASLDANAKIPATQIPGVYVVETSPKSLLPSWYRVWSDGWCEQGGVVSGINPTVTLLQTYKNIDYHILCLQQGTSGNYNANLRAQAVDTNSFGVFQEGGGSLFWQTCGYIN